MMFPKNRDEESHLAPAFGFRVRWEIIHALLGGAQKR